MPETRYAVLYFGLKRIVAFPMNKVTLGYYLASDPYICAEGDSPFAVGRAVRSAIDAFRTDYPPPGRDGYPAISAARHRAAGVRSEAAFIREGRMVYVTKNDEITLIPSKKAGSGPKLWHERIEEKSVRISADADDLALGAACVQAIAACE